MGILKKLDQQWALRSEAQQGLDEEQLQKRQRQEIEKELAELAKVWVSKSKDMAGVCDPLRSNGGKKNV